MNMDMLLMIPVVIVVTIAVDYALIYIISCAGMTSKDDVSETEEKAG